MSLGTDFENLDWDRPAPQTHPHEQGTIVAVTDAGIRFTLDDFPSTVGFGPAPYPQWTASGDVTLSGPQAGDKCLVAFAGPGISRPWVLAWSSD